MDHISNFLNFSAGNKGADNDDINKSTGVPIFDDLPLDTPIQSPAEHAITKDESAAIDSVELKKRLYALKDEVGAIIRLLELAPEKISIIDTPKNTAQSPAVPITSTSGDQIIEGKFSGEKMIGPDGHEYAVPPNYASKSKLVEGDHMKLTITPYGKFIYKQIGPIERKRIIGVLHFDEPTQLWSVVHEGKTYKILTASATFYHGKPGDHVVVLVPKDIPSAWGAVENIIAS